jgi:hypothetical protein
MQHRSQKASLRKRVTIIGQEDGMKPNPKWTAATLVVLAAATVSTMHALAIASVPMVHESDGASANGSKTYDEWQAPLSRSFRARFLDHRTAEDAIVGGASGRGFTLRIFDGLEKMQIWDDSP